MPAGHAFVTDNSEASPASRQTLRRRLRHDQAGEILKRIYGPLAPRAAAPAGTFQEFDQHPFFDGISNHAPWQIAASPTSRPPAPRTPPVACTSAYPRLRSEPRHRRRRLHPRDPALRPGPTRRRFFIVTIPRGRGITRQTARSCWDYTQAEGYTSEDYLVRDAPQIEIVYRMLKQTPQNRGLDRDQPA